MTISNLIGRQRNAPITSEDKEQRQFSTLLRFFPFSLNRHSGYTAVDDDLSDSRRQPFLPRTSTAVLCQDCKPPMASIRVLRTISAISLVPGFALPIAPPPASGWSRSFSLPSSASGFLSMAARTRAQRSPALCAPTPTQTMAASLTFAPGGRSRSLGLRSDTQSWCSSQMSSSPRP